MGVEKCLFLLYCECMGNNRTTLESKARLSQPLKCTVGCNNRTTLESKGPLRTSGTSAKRVIIEPHWNLKADQTGFVQVGASVIIEPHWNLKPGVISNCVKGVLGNNRTTLESKVMTGLGR